MTDYESQETYRRYTDTAVAATKNHQPPAYAPNRTPQPPEYTLTFEERSPEPVTRTLSPCASPLVVDNGEMALTGWEGVHRRLSIDDESETSSVDEKFYAPSITSSLDDQLT